MSKNNRTNLYKSDTMAQIISKNLLKEGMVVVKRKDANKIMKRN